MKTDIFTQQILSGTIQLNLWNKTLELTKQF